MKKAKPRRGDGVVVLLFYHKDCHPKIFHWEYQTRYHFENCLQGYFIVGDKMNRIPHIVICYVNNNFECMLTIEKVQNEKLQNENKQN